MYLIELTCLDGSYFCRIRLDDRESFRLGLNVKLGLKHAWCEFLCEGVYGGFGYPYACEAMVLFACISIAQLTRQLRALRFHLAGIPASPYVEDVEYRRQGFACGMVLHLPRLELNHA